MDKTPRTVFMVLHDDTGVKARGDEWGLACLSVEIGGDNGQYESLCLLFIFVD